MKNLFLVLSVAAFAVLPLRAYGAEGFISAARSTQPSSTSPAPSNHPLIKHRQSIELNDGTVRSVAFSPDGEMLACGGNRDVHLFRVDDGSRLRRLRGHTASVRCVAFSRDGKMLASGSEDTKIRLWDTQSGKLRKVLKQFRGFVPVNGVAFTPNGRTLVSCSSRNSGNSYLWIWDVANGWWEYMAQTVWPRFPLHLAVSPDGTLICVGEFPGNVALYEFAKFGVRERFVREQARQARGKPQGFHMHHDENKEVSSVTFSPDGQTILSSAWDNTVRLWDVKTGRQMLKISGSKDEKGFAGAVFSPDGSRIISVARDETIRMWDVANGKLLAALKGKGKSVRGLAISPDGSILATCGGEGVVKLWDIQFAE